MADRIYHILCEKGAARTPFVRLSRHPSKEIVLIGTVHLATHWYYRTLMKRIRYLSSIGYVLLCEGLGSADSRSPAIAAIRSAAEKVQKAISDLTGLAHQRDHLLKDSFLQISYADLDDAGAERLVDMSESVQGLKRLIEQQTPEELAWMFVDTILDRFFPEYSEQDALFLDRNRHAVELAVEAARERPVVLTYGAGHIPDMCHRLTLQGWETKSVEYIPAVPLARLRKLKRRQNQ